MVYLCYTDLFEMELFTCIKMDLPLNNQKRLICHKSPNKQTNKLIYLYGFFTFLAWSEYTSSFHFQLFSLGGSLKLQNPLDDIF